MPSDDRTTLALSALKPSIGAFRTVLLTTADEVRAYLTIHQSSWDGLVARVAEELGPLASGRIDPARFAGVVNHQQVAEPGTVEVVEQALEALTALAAAGDALYALDVPPGGSLYETVGRGLERIGQAFSAARVVQAARAGRPPTGEVRPGAPLPFSRWTRAERRLAPPLVVGVQGSDLRAAALAEFMDGRQRLVLVVEGDCPPAPLARLVGPGTFVAQSADAAPLARMSRWDGPGIAALVPEGAARFVHDPSGGSAVPERLTIDFVPDKAPRRSLGGLSPAQQAEELELLRSLARRSEGSAVAAGPAVAAGASAAGAAADPADRLASWLLSQVDLSDTG